MAPPRRQAKPQARKPTMDKVTKNARHSASENNRLRNIANGMSEMFAMLPAEIQNVPGAQKNQTLILRSFCAEIDKELKLQEDIEAEKGMLEMHVQNGTIPPVSGEIYIPGINHPPMTMGISADGTEPTFFEANQFDNNLDNQPTHWDGSNSNLHGHDNNSGIPSNNPDAPLLNVHQMDNSNMYEVNDQSFLHPDFRDSDNGSSYEPNGGYPNYVESDQTSVGLGNDPSIPSVPSHGFADAQQFYGNEQPHLGISDQTIVDPPNEPNDDGAWMDAYLKSQEYYSDIEDLFRDPETGSSSGTGSTMGP